MSVVTTPAGDVPRAELTVADSRYPALLREIHDPPALLHVRGDPSLLAAPLLAIVGSRRASAAGLRLAAELAGELGRAGLGICSGLALGIDAAAHRGALEAGAPTVAVMGTGIEDIYPRRHRALGEAIAGAGCLVTEFPRHTPPHPGNFPQRNRIISGLSLGVLVVEAATASGSLITARCALEQGREVFALPWSTLHDGGRGCLQLLRDGAKMVQCVDDVLEELGPLYALNRERAPVSTLSSTPSPTSSYTPSPEAADSWLMPLLGFEATPVDALVEASGRPAAQVLRELSALEMGGLAERAPGGFRRR